jgi:uncharacterized protein YceK
VQARWTQEGRPREETIEVKVRANKTATVSFDTSPLAKRCVLALAGSNLTGAARPGIEGDHLALKAAVRPGGRVMSPGRVACLAAVLLASAGGCATAINMQQADMRKPYGGVTMPLDDFFGGGEAGDYVLVRFWPIWLLDKPLSLAADTLTLPYTLWVQRATWLPEKKPATTPGRAGATVPPAAGDPSAGGVVK